MFLQVENDEQILRKFPIKSGKIKIGGTFDCDIFLDLGAYNSTITDTLNVLLIKDGKYQSRRFATYLNNQKIHQPKQLKAGDVICFEPSGKLRIVVKNAAIVSKNVFITIGGGILILAFLLCFAIYSNFERPPAGNKAYAPNTNTKAVTAVQNSPFTKEGEWLMTDNMLETNSASEIQVLAETLSPEQLLKVEIGNFSKKIMTNNSKYTTLPAEQGLRLIREKIEENTGNSELEAAFNNFGRSANRSPLLARIRQRNLPVALVLTSCLIDLNGRDLASVCDQEIEKIRKLSVTFGASESDSSLLIIAAKYEGSSTTKSHTLIEKIRHLSPDPKEDRNVWLLYSKNGLAERTLDKVVQFIALGLIAQNPRKYQIDADPIL